MLEKLEVQGILKGKSEVRNQWLNCNDGQIKGKLRKTENEYSNGIGTFKIVAIKLRRRELRNIIDN
jgi:hypothetical protein